jgi:hypothetical protein
VHKIRRHLYASFEEKAPWLWRHLLLDSHDWRELQTSVSYFEGKMLGPLSITLTYEGIFTSSAVNKSAHWIKGDVASEYKIPHYTIVGSGVPVHWNNTAREVTKASKFQLIAMTK